MAAFSQRTADMKRLCEELASLPERHRSPVQPSSLGCQECLALGSGWVHLRLCLTCGHVGCCDASPNRHATAHYRATAHPVVKSFEPGEGWAYCYAHGLLAELERTFREESPPRHYGPPSLNA